MDDKWKDEEVRKLVQMAMRVSSSPRETVLATPQILTVLRTFSCFRPYDEEQMTVD